MIFKTVTSTINNLNDQARKLTIAILNVQNFYLKNIFFFFEEKIAQNSEISIELRQNLKSQIMPSKRGGNLRHH